MKEKYLSLIWDAIIIGCIFGLFCQIVINMFLGFKFWWLFNLALMFIFVHTVAVKVSHKDLMKTLEKNTPMEE